MFTVTKQGSVSLVKGEGVFNQEAVNAAWDVFTNCLRQAPPRIVFDLAEIVLLDSAALEFLLDVQDQCSLRGGVLHLARPNGLCTDSLRITGLTDHFEVFADSTAAIRSFSI